MAKKNNYYDKLMLLETEVVDALVKELKRIGRDFTMDDADEIEFWNFSTPVKENIVKILADGTIVCENSEEYSMSRAVNDGIIPLHDAISIYNDVCVLKKK